MNPSNKSLTPPKVNAWEEKIKKRKEKMEAERLKSQAPAPTPAPPEVITPKTQSTKPPSQPTASKPQPKPTPPQTATPQPPQEISLISTLQELQDPQVVELLTTMKKIVIIAKQEKTQGEKAIELSGTLTALPLKSTNWKDINSNSPDIIAIQETFLRPCFTFNFPNYSSYRNDRLTHRGGGTAILVKNSIAHHSINIYTNVVEVTAIEIEGPTGNITICSLYRPPASATKNFIQDLSKIFSNRTQCLTVGDFNAKHRTWNLNRPNNTPGTALFNYARANGLVISVPTDPTIIPAQ
ncbi:RNA-directed DNA polymerase from mobile element jockey [Trichonephila inaurata madagascariensis]|uniref:RNA-directed DNA polymerase from mobile element jockey n=1 Tax=Trichonephila inaurata madagascariensis TaxID=2747483 RepID=A0A8X6MLR3_9ARAC|nr:RNA-directed DNA polymerase from mobile element jockey [Trichonephila inaurata madagascariensis]